MAQEGSHRRQSRNLPRSAGSQHRDTLPWPGLGAAAASALLEHPLARAGDPWVPHDAARRLPCFACDLTINEARQRSVWLSRARGGEGCNARQPEENRQPTLPLRVQKPVGRAAALLRALPGAPAQCGAPGRGFTGMLLLGRRAGPTAGPRLLAGAVQSPYFTQAQQPLRQRARHHVPAA